MDNEYEVPQPQEPQKPVVSSDQLPDDIKRDVVQPPKPKTKKKWLWLGLAAILVAAGLAYWFFVREDKPQASINSYDDCVAAGHPIMESYPEQCAVPGGQTFTRQLNEEEQAALDESTPDEPVVEDCTESESSKEPVSFDLPDGWTKQSECFTRDGGEPIWFIYTTSPDYKYENDVGGMGGGGVTQGTQVLVSVERIESLQSSYNSTESILDGTAESKSSFTEVESIAVGNYKGVEYKSYYEGPGAMISKFDINGYEYGFVIGEDIDGPNFSDHLDEYRQIVQSFELN